MKAVSMQEAKDQLEKLIEEASHGELIEITNGDKKVTLAPNYMFLDLEEDSPELEAELLKAVNGPHHPMREGELREIADQALREHRAKQQK
jgi:hypothetical protein